MAPIVRRKLRSISQADDVSTDSQDRGKTTQAPLYSLFTETNQLDSLWQTAQS